MKIHETNSNGCSRRPMARRPRNGRACVPIAQLIAPARTRADGIPFADGYCGLLHTMVNERDGGIGGIRAMTKVVECETAYNTEKGVECYESYQRAKAFIGIPTACRQA